MRGVGVEKYKNFKKINKNKKRRRLKSPEIGSEVERLGSKMGKITRRPQRKRERFGRISKDKCGRACDIVRVSYIVLCGGLFVFVVNRVGRS